MKRFVMSCSAGTVSVLAFFLILLAPSLLHASGEYAMFEHITVEDGLSQSMVTSIIQDRKGFMWFGTMDGLNKYDGYTFTIFRHDKDNPRSLSNNFILWLYEDRSGIIWIGTYGGGLNRYDPSTEMFYQCAVCPGDSSGIEILNAMPIFQDSDGTIWAGTDKGLIQCNGSGEILTLFSHDPENPNSISENFTHALYEDSSGILWIGTNGGGLDRFDAHNKTFRHYVHDPRDSGSISSDFVYSIVEDRSGVLWVGNQGTINRYDRARDKFERYPLPSPHGTDASTSVIFTLYEDKSQVLWMATDDGVYSLNPERTRFTHYRHDPGNSGTLGSDLVQTLYEDWSEILWFGTSRGINKFDRGKSRFRLYRHDYINPNSLSDDFVLTVYEDRNGYIWIGTDRGGLNRYDPLTERFTRYRHKPGDTNSIPADWVTAVCEDGNGFIWVGTGYGIARMNPRTGAIRQYRHDPNKPGSLGNNWVLDIIEDSRGIIWIGTGGGLDRFDSKSGTFTHFRHDPADPNTLSHNIVRTILEDCSGNLWLGTNSGLNLFNPESGTCKRYMYDPAQPGSLSNNRITTLHEDRSGTLWVGTADGLNRFNRADDTFYVYTTTVGLINNVISGMLEDNAGNLWISTNGGISCFDWKNESITNYSDQDGLFNAGFYPGACCKTKSGEMYFGGVDGLNRFNPHALEHSLYVPPVVITSIKKFDRNLTLDKSVSEVSEINLSYKDTFISFEFAALDYSSPRKNQYAYMMEGFDQDWIYSGSRRYASYTNLNPGKYVFRVKGSSHDGVWNETGSSIRIRIVPPFWEAEWFRIIAGFSLAGTVLILHQMRVRNVKKQQRVLEEQVQIRTRELKETTDALHLEQKRLFSLLDGLPAVVILQTPDKSITYANKRFLDDLSECEDGSYLRHTAENTEPCPDCSIQKILEVSGTEACECMLPDRRVFQIYMYPFSDIDGTPGVLKLGIDVTDRKRAEEERLKQEKLRGVLETAGAASHELNQPLQVISGYIEMITAGIIQKPDTGIMRVIGEQVKRLREITLKLNKITRYKTMDYITGTRIIDIDGSSRKDG
ncbi:histidine kinase [bacterium]|nr:histidine kinase [bacterium]